MKERKYIAISIKHSGKNSIVYWGTRTKDDEERCKSGYTHNVENCELYAEEDFNRNIYPVVHNVKSISGLMKEYKDTDTVLVLLDEWKQILAKDNEKMREKRQKKGANTLCKGDKVVMHTCGEAFHYRGKIWTCTCDSYDDCGTELVFLEGFSGAFATEYLQVVNIDEISEKEKEMIANTPITPECFEKWEDYKYEEIKVKNFPHPYEKWKTCTLILYPTTLFESLIRDCEAIRQKYLETKNEHYLDMLLYLLPKSYRMTKTN